jgi:hypothetical protein
MHPGSLFLGFSLFEFSCSSNTSTIKEISVKLGHTIVHQADLDRLCGDVSLAFVNVFTNKLVYAIAGPKFGEHEGKTTIIRKALHGLCTSCKCQTMALTFHQYTWEPGFHADEIL